MAWGDAPRRRAKKRADKERFDRLVEAVVAELAYHHVVSPTQWLCITRSKQVLGRKCRYRPSFITEKLIDVMDMLAGPELGLADLQLGHQRRALHGGYVGRQTRLRAGERLIERITGLGLAVEDFGLLDSEEVIVLKGPRGDSFWDVASLMDYDDTPQTNEMRWQLRRINRWLAAAAIEYSGTRKVDTAKRRLTRRFSNGRFDHHGRMYGAFWENMPKEERLECVTIDGAPVVGLDYGQMAIRLLYAETGQAPHFEDAYAVPGLEGHRAGVKKLLNAMLASSKPLKRLPMGVGRLLPRGMRLPDLVDMVVAFHAPVRQHFHAGCSLRLMYLESQVMVQVLLRLIDEGVTALPVHDGLIVAEQHEHTARAAMLDCFRQATGFEGVVKAETAVAIDRDTHRLSIQGRQEERDPMSQILD